MEGYKREEALFPYPVLISKWLAGRCPLGARVTLSPPLHSRKKRGRGLQKPAEGGKWRTRTCCEDYYHTGWAQLRTTGVLTPQLSLRNHHCQFFHRAWWSPFEASHCCCYHLALSSLGSHFCPPNAAPELARRPPGQQVQPHHSCNEQQRPLHSRTGPERWETSRVVSGVSAKGYFIQTTIRAPVQL